MAVIVWGEQAVLRIKVAYVSAPVDGARAVLEGWASNAEAAPSTLSALGEDDGPLVYSLDVAPGVASPREGVVVRAYLYGADADDLESPALAQALQVCDALVLVAEPRREGATRALHAFGQSLGCMLALEQKVDELPIVVQRRAPREDDVPSAELESALAAMRRQARGGFARLFGGSKGNPIAIVEERDPKRASAEALSRAVSAALRSPRVRRYVASIMGGGG